MARRSKSSATLQQSRLPMFQSRPVQEMQGKFKFPGSVLDQKMKLDPNPHDSGEECYFIIRCMVEAVDHKPTVLAAGVPFRRIEHFVVQEAVEVEGEDVKAYLDQSRIALEVAEREAHKEDLAGGQGSQQDFDDNAAPDEG